VKLEFFGTPEIYLPEGGTIKLRAPDEITVLRNEVICYDVINNLPCEVTVRYQTFTVTVPRELLIGKQF
jgi:hypothetical protein